jgi:hypothetical protein
LVAKVVVVVVLVVALIQVVVAVDVSHSTVDAETDDRSIVHVVSQLSLLLGGAIVFISLLYLLRKHVGLVKRIRFVETTMQDTTHNILEATGSLGESYFFRIPREGRQKQLRVVNMFERHSDEIRGTVKYPQ